MRIHRSTAQKELCRDRLICLPLSEKIKHLTFLAPSANPTSRLVGYRRWRPWRTPSRGVTPYQDRSADGTVVTDCCAGCAFGTVAIDTLGWKNRDSNHLKGRINRTNEGCRHLRLTLRPRDPSQTCQGPDNPPSITHLTPQHQCFLIESSSLPVVSRLEQLAPSSRVPLPGDTGHHVQRRSSGMPQLVPAPNGDHHDHGRRYSREQCHRLCPSIADDLPARQCSLKVRFRPFPVNHFRVNPERSNTFASVNESPHSGQ